MRIINWNVKWASPKSINGALISQEIFKNNPDVVCITEGYESFFQKGYTINSSADYGYKITPNRRKVLLWSSNPWKEVDPIGDPSLPPGRFVSGITMTSIGDIRFIGVCIPWRDAHVITGRKNRKRWEDHVTYLKGLAKILSVSNEIPLIVIGDFNQRIPRIAQPIEIFEQLIDSMPSKLNIATVGAIPDLNKQTIDHVAYTREIFPKKVSSLDNQHQSLEDNRVLSDHFGVIVDFEIAE